MYLAFHSNISEMSEQTLNNLEHVPIRDCLGFRILRKISIEKLACRINGTVEKGRLSRTVCWFIHFERGMKMEESGLLPVRRSVLALPYHSNVEWCNHKCINRMRQREYICKWNTSKVCCALGSSLCSSPDHSLWIDLSFYLGMFFDIFEFVD